MKTTAAFYLLMLLATLGLLYYVHQESKEPTEEPGQRLEQSR